MSWGIIFDAQGRISYTPAKKAGFYHPGKQGLPVSVVARRRRHPYLHPAPGPGTWALRNQRQCRGTRRCAQRTSIAEDVGREDEPRAEATIPGPGAPAPSACRGRDNRAVPPEGLILPALSFFPLSYKGKKGACEIGVNRANPLKTYL